MSDYPGWDPGKSDPELLHSLESWLFDQERTFPEGDVRDMIEQRVDDVARWISQLSYEKPSNHWWGNNA